MCPYVVSACVLSAHHASRAASSAVLSAKLYPSDIQYGCRRGAPAVLDRLLLFFGGSHGAKIYTRDVMGYYSYFYSIIQRNANNNFSELIPPASECSFVCVRVCWGIFCRVLRLLSLITFTQ